MIYDTKTDERFPGLEVRIPRTDDALCMVKMPDGSWIDSNVPAAIAKADPEGEAFCLVFAAHILVAQHDEHVMFRMPPDLESQSSLCEIVRLALLAGLIHGPMFRDDDKVGTSEMVH